MDATTLTTTNITLSGGKSCKSIDYNSSAYSARCWVYECNLSDRLDSNTTYTVSVGTNVKDSSGNALASAYTFSFTTGVDNNLSRLRTGQTTSYANYDDAWYVTNQNLGIARSFTRNGANGTVTDNATGLMWQDDAAAASTTATWTTATTTTCQALNTSSFGGYTDWRLPTIEELVTIADKGDTSAPRIFTEFQQTASDPYWSSSTFVPFTGYVWGVSFFAGNDYANSRTFSYAVRCVRAGQ